MEEYQNLERIKSNLAENHFQLFDQEARTFVKAPARINIIGEHIDYLGGKVLPANLDIYLFAAFSKSKKFHFYSSKVSRKILTFDDQNKFHFIPTYGYANYVLGIVQTLRDHGHRISPFSFNLVTQMPIASGLSSSSAFGVLILVALRKMFALKMNNTEIAKTFQEVENNYLNLKNGIMSKFIISNGLKDTAMLLDISDLSYQLVKIGDLQGARFWIINSNKARAVVDSKINKRLLETSKALKYLKAHFNQNFVNLSSLPFKQKEQILKVLKNPILKMRTQYVIEENERINNIIKAFDNNDALEVGKILNDAHQGLKNLYQVTSPELDFIHDYLNQIPDVLGVKMTGVGFGGSLIALTKFNDQSFFDDFLKAYKEKFNLEAEIYPINFVDHAKIF